MKISRNIEKFTKVVCDGKCTKCKGICSDIEKNYPEKTLVCNGLCNKCKNQKYCDGNYLEIDNSANISIIVIMFIIIFFPAIKKIIKKIIKKSN